MEEKVNQRQYVRERSDRPERKPNKYEKEIADWFEQLLRKYSDIKLWADMMVSADCGISIDYSGFDEYNEKNGIFDPSDDDASIYICNNFECMGIWFTVERHKNDVFTMKSDAKKNDTTYIKVLKRVLYFKPLIEKFLEMDAKRQMETGESCWIR